MKSLEIILRERGFDGITYTCTSFYKEDIKDNEYILMSTLQDKKQKAQKNLMSVFFPFCIDNESTGNKVIKESIDEFVFLYGS